ncbi:MAG: leucine-rich repeat domain-containing protein [Bacteroidales bacterium]|nr:leucine-rich repeat domain-containing protein [Bacteroidales bacterium]
MKKIFTIRYAMAAITASAVIVALTVASCTKTEELSGAKEKITTLDASLAGGTKAEAVLGGDEIDLATGTKVTLTDNANSLGVGGMGVVWKTGDAFYVFDGPLASSVPSKFTLTDGSATASAKFSGSFSSTNGNQLYAIYAPWAPQETKPANWVANGHVVELTGVEAGGSFKTPMTNSSLGNYSIMYGGVKYTSGSIPKITFKNALVAIKITFPTTGGFRYVRACSADGSMCNTATMKLSGGGTDGKSPDISWSNKGMYGTRQLWNQTTDANFAQFPTFYFLMLPQSTSKGLTIVFTKGGTGATATEVYYTMLTGSTELVGGNYYKIPSTLVKQGALLSSSTAPSSAFWYCTVDPSSSDYIRQALNSATSNKTVVIPDSFTSTPKYVQNSTYLETFIANGCTSLASSMFNGCTSLKNVSIANVTALPDYAFRGCTALESIYLPSVTSLSTTNGFTFANCSNLKKITFGTLISSSQNWYSAGVFNGIDATTIDLVLKKGQTGITGTGNNIINGIKFNSITLVD